MDLLRAPLRHRLSHTHTRPRSHGTLLLILKGCRFIIVIRVFYAFLRCVLPRTLLGFLLFLVLHLFSLNFAKYLYGIVLAGSGCYDQVGFYGGEPGFYGLGQEVLLVQDGFGGFGNLGVGGFFGYVLCRFALFQV